MGTTVSKRRSRDQVSRAGATLTIRRARAVASVLLVFCMLVPRASWACPQQQRDDTLDVAGGSLTEDPIVIADGTVTVSATDAVLPGCAGAWAHRREYSSKLTAGMPIQGAGWKVDCLTAFLFPCNDEWDNQGSWQLYADAVKSRIIEYQQGTASYRCADEMMATFKVDSYGGKSCFKLEFPRTGQKYYFADATPSDWDEHEMGSLKYEVDAYGNCTSYNYDPGTRRVTSITTEQGWVVVYDYIPTGQANAGKIDKFKVYDGDDPETDNILQQVEYTYYSSGAGYSTDVGSDGDLIMVKVSRRTTKGALAGAGTTMYRYYRGEQGDEGLAHQLKMVFSPASVAQTGMALQLDDDGAVGANQLKDYANVVYTYYRSDYDTGQGGGDSLNVSYGGGNFTELGYVKTQTIRKDQKGAIGTHTFYYMLNDVAGNTNNIVKYITVEDFGGRRVYGTNKDRLLLREVRVGGKPWCKSFRRGEARTGEDWEEQDNETNKVIEERMPSMHSCVDEDEIDDFLDVVEEDDWGGLMNEDKGQVRLYAYNPQGNLTSEKLLDKAGSGVKYIRCVQYGDGETVPQDLPVKVWNYHSASSDSENDAASLWTEIEYTFYETEGEVNTWHQVREKTMTREALGTGENGPGVQVETKEYYDAKGRLCWTRDGEGYVHQYSYDPNTGGVILEVRDVDTGIGNPPFTRTATATPVELVTEYEYDGLGRQIKMERLVKEGEGGPPDEVIVTATAYGGNITRVYPEWTGTTANLPIQVTQVNDEGAIIQEYSVDASEIEIDVSNDMPTGADTDESQVDYLSWTRYAYWDDAGAADPFKRNNALLKWTDRYHEIPDDEEGELSTDFHRTVYRHDDRGLQTHVIEVVSGIDPDATDEMGCVEQVTVTGYNVHKRVESVLRGVSPEGHAMKTTYDNDTGLSVKMVSRNFYDESTPGTHTTAGVGDGFLTSQCVYYDDNNSQHDTNAVKTCYHRNGLGQLRGIEPESPPYTVQDVDLRGNVLATAQFVEKPDWGDVLGDGDYAENANDSDRRTLTKTKYDQAGHLYRTITYAVNSSGVKGKKLVTDNYYDRNGRLVATYSPGKGGAETAYDGAGRQIETRTVTNLENPKYDSGAFQYRDPQPGGSTGGNDGVIQITRTAYDKAGNVTEKVTMEANHLKTDGATLNQDGLSLTASGGEYDYVQTAVYHWYDPDTHQLATTANYGSGDSAWKHASLPTRESYANRPTASSASCLVTTSEYNAAGLLKIVTDPKGVKTKYVYDDLARKTRTIENYLASGTDPDENRSTVKVYDGLSNVIKHIADLDRGGTESTGDQVTTYTYYHATYSPHRADLVTKVAYPDSTGDSDTVRTQYYLDGSIDTQTDQRGTVITYEYDDESDGVGLHRLEKQRVTTAGTGLDTTVQSVKTEYDDVGRRTKVTSYPSNDCSGTPVNQVQFTYNDLGALEKEHQEHEGAVDADTLYVRYNYDTSSGTYNGITDVYTKAMRLESVGYPAVYRATAPNERVRPASSISSRLAYHLYKDAKAGAPYEESGIGDAISRIAAIATASTRGQNDANVLASYLYNGNGRLVVEDFKQPDLRLDYYDDYSDNPTAGTYEGFDRFGRIIQQVWRDYGASSYADRYAYDYDYNSNRLWRDNVVASDAAKKLDEQYEYDDLDRLEKFRRGVLDGSHTIPTTGDNCARREHWGLSPTGNWSDYQIDADGDDNFTDDTDLDQDRAHNLVNEVTDITEQADPEQCKWADPAYDACGNMKALPKPTDFANAFACQYDAWNRLVLVFVDVNTNGQYDAGTDKQVAKYEYDGLHRRAKAHIDTDAPADPDGVDTWRHFYYNNKWQVLEIRETTSAENDEPETLQPGYQYVWSVRYIDAPVLRDENTDTDDACDDERLYYLSDANQNVTALAEDDGDAVERYLYDPYGNVTVMNGSWTESSPSYDNHILFAGYYRDSETGLYHVRNRMYHAPLGLWLIRDPEGYVDGMSLYEYVGGNPAGRLDLSGNSWVGDAWEWTEEEYRAANQWSNEFNTAAVAAVQNTIGLGVDVATAAGQGFPEYAGDSSVPYRDPSTGREYATENRACAAATSLREDPLGTAAGVAEGLARQVDGVLRGDPVAWGTTTVDVLTAKASLAAGKATGVTGTLKQLGATAKVTVKGAAGKVVKAVAGKADDVASKVDDASTRVARPAQNTAVSRHHMSPQAQRSLSERIHDFQRNPNNWDRVSASAEKATAGKARGGVSIESTFRHKTTGETLHVHDVYKPSGVQIGKHPSYRAYGKGGT